MKKEARKHIVLGVTGSIAAYKAAELVRLMKKKGWDVSVVMTEAAERFVSRLTFRTLSNNPVLCGMFDEIAAWDPAHVSLAARTDALVIAPCTANVLAKLAHGLADDLLSATALACAAPLVLAPAMNERMWLHQATRANVELLKSRGAIIVEVESGELACGREGAGRLAAPEKIMAAVEKSLCA